MRARTTWAALVLAGLVLAAAGADDKKDGDDADKTALQGTWQAVTSEVDGDKQADDEVKPYTLVFTGDKLVVNKSGECVMEGTIMLNAAQDPKHLDLKLEKNSGNPDDVGKTMPGIYAVKGDELKWCFTLPGGGTERPKEFKTEAGSGRVNAVLKREKK